MARQGEELLVNHEYSPFDLPGLVAYSDIVVRASITSVTIGESAASPFITTDCTVDVHDVFVSRDGQPVAPGTRLHVRREGGQLVVDGRVFTVRDSLFPPFEVGDQYVLFLKSAAGGAFFDVVAGPQGAFKIDGVLVARQVAHYEGDTPEERPNVDGPVDVLKARVIDAASRRR
jgi:hypothetical protein